MQALHLGDMVPAFATTIATARTGANRQNKSGQ